MLVRAPGPGRRRGRSRGAGPEGDGSWASPEGHRLRGALIWFSIGSIFWTHRESGLRWGLQNDHLTFSAGSECCQHVFHYHFKQQTLGAGVLSLPAMG